MRINNVHLYKIAYRLHLILDALKKVEANVHLYRVDYHFHLIILGIHEKIKRVYCGTNILIPLIRHVVDKVCQRLNTTVPIIHTMMNVHPQIVLRPINVSLATIDLLMKISVQINHLLIVVPFQNIYLMVIPVHNVQLMIVPIQTVHLMSILVTKIHLMIIFVQNVHLRSLTKIHLVIIFVQIVHLRSLPIPSGLHLIIVHVSNHHNLKIISD